MSISSAAQRSVPPFPDPNDRNQGRINRQIIDVVRFLISRFDVTSTDKRIADLETKLSQLADEIDSIKRRI